MAEKKELDWVAIKSDYVAGDISYQALAEKYGTTFNVIKQRGCGENWVEQRRQWREETAKKSLAEEAKKAVNYRKEIYKASFAVLGQLTAFIDKYNLEEMIPHGIKPRDITAALKDCSDLLHVRSAADVREQAARIKNLEKQAAGAGDDKEITIKIAGEAADYAK